MLTSTKSSASYQKSATGWLASRISTCVEKEMLDSLSKAGRVLWHGQWQPHEHCSPTYMGRYKE